MKKISYLEILKTFLKIGATCWGGPAIVAYIQKEIVEKKKWLSDEEFKETLGFCQLFPGPIAVQTAAHIGFRIKGLLGSLLAFLFYTLPTFVLMLILSYFYFKYEKFPSFLKLFEFLDSVIVAIIIEAIWSMRKIVYQNYKGMLLVFLSVVAFLLNGQVVLILLAAGLGGVLLFEKESGKRIPFKNYLISFGKVSLFPIFSLLLLPVIFFLVEKIIPNIGLLCFKMAKVNLLAFGGGYTAVALMFKESVLNTNWLTENEFINGLALGQITPGPVIITATFIGYKVGGLIGAVLATIAVFFPSYFILILLSPLYKEISSLSFLKAFTLGLLCAFMGMLFQLLVHLTSTIEINSINILVILVSVILLRLKVSPIYLILLSSVISLIS